MIDLDTHPRSYVHAPFTEEQVACIRAYQDSPIFHSFTCCANGNNGSIKHSDSRILGVKSEGMFCVHAGCGYTQEWVHGFMAEYNPLDWEKLLPKSDPLRLP